MRQHELLFGESLVSRNKPNLAPMSIGRCSKSQGLGHTTSDFPNKEFVTLAECEAAMKEESEEESEDERDHKLDELQEEATEEFWEEFYAIKEECEMNHQSFSPLHPHPKHSAQISVNPFLNPC